MGATSGLRDWLRKPGTLVAERIPRRILRTRLSARLGLSDPERITLAEIGKRLGRRALREVACVAKPDTILAWYRRLVAQKFGSKHRQYPGRPPVSSEVVNLVVRMARENSGWGYDRIVGALANLGYRVSDHQGTWGYLHPCRYVLHDRDTTFCASFRSVLANGGVKTIQLPAKSPILNAFAERWVRSVKQECLSKLILFGEGPLLRVLAEYSRHYHRERNHQGKGNRLLVPDVSENGHPLSRNVVCRQRLGGLLKYYQRAA